MPNRYLHRLIPNPSPKRYLGPWYTYKNTPKTSIPSYVSVSQRYMSDPTPRPAFLLPMYTYADLL